MSQYEPIVLKKRQPRTVAGTPAGLAYNILKCTMIVIPATCLYLFSNYLLKKKELIAELDEYDLYNKKLSKLEEYRATSDTWKSPFLQGAALIVLENYRAKGQLTTIDENSPTAAEVRGDKQ